MSREIEFSEDDQPLREDVGLLGRLLGEVLREQGPNWLYDRVEEVRTASIARRAGESSADPCLASALCGLEPADAAELVRAFSAYFSLVNMAERVHRIRRRRHWQHNPETPQKGSLAAVIRSLADDGVNLETLTRHLHHLRVEPVFTAHPTESVRRTLLKKEQRVARVLVDRLEHANQTPPEARALEARLKNQITLMWQTDEHPGVVPTVADEVEHVVFYLADILYRVVPPLYEALAAAIDANYDADQVEPLPTTVLRFGTWVGGDMDGNPNVGPETLLATLERQRQVIVERYRTEIRKLFDHLSQSSSRVTVDPQVLQRTTALKTEHPEVWKSIPARYHEMPYRVLLWLMWARLDATSRDAPEGYDSPSELAEDLSLISTSLKNHHGAFGGLFLVERLQRKVETFGFHLATLDVRQDSLAHRQAVARLLGIEGFPDLETEKRTDLLRAALFDNTPIEDAADPALTIFSAIAAARRRFGPQAVGPYIISMAEGIDDVLAVLWLARTAGLQDGRGQILLDVAPLFETVDDLENAGSTVEDMLTDQTYLTHVRQRRRQVVMLGYSDSSKISGITASRWALYRAQEKLVQSCSRHDVELELFHGRGGTVGRGGSKPRSAVLAEPDGAVRGRLRVTEQGEIINAKFGLRGIAERTLEVMTGAVLEVTARHTKPKPPHPQWVVAMATAADAARRSHGELAHNHPDFIPYFRAATPIDVIERLRIGSRPPSRRSGGGVENLRAIPWVFAWMQSRHLLPGWFGVGSGLDQAAQAHGESVLEDMAGGWPFFANLLADVEMVLAKADMAIASRYAQLADAHGDCIFPIIESEFQMTTHWVARLQGVTTVLDREPILQRAIRLRNPYVDPMSLLQVDLLQRWRAGDRCDKDLEDALVATIRGIARGLQNTG